MRPGQRRRGRPSKGKAARTSVVLRPPYLLERLQRSADEEGTDVSGLLRRLAEAYLKRRKGARL